MDATKKLVQALVISRLDYCNSLLYCIHETLLDKLQRVQNAAARLIFKTSKYEHITPTLKNLHWLKIRQRIKFKILTLTYKILFEGENPNIWLTCCSGKQAQELWDQIQRDCWNNPLGTIKLVVLDVFLSVHHFCGTIYPSTSEIAIRYYHFENN